MVVNSYERNLEAKIKFILLYQLLIIPNLEICYHSTDGSIYFFLKLKCYLKSESYHLAQTKWQGDDN